MIENINNGEGGLSVRTKLNELISAVNSAVETPAGTSGTDGSSGTSGIGTNGSSGTSGANGVIGSNGISGSSGTSGVGTNGSAGTSGVGTNGSAGTSGTRGTSGTSGGNGSSGTSGIGTNGTSGTSGGNGSSGTSGIGTNGSAGTSGINGSSGTSGIGTNGTSGTSGINGQDGISSGRVYYFKQSSTDTTYNTYKVLTDVVTSSVQQTILKTTTGLTPTLVQQFITPQLGFNVIPGGNQLFHLHFLKASSGTNIDTFVTIQLFDTTTGTLLGSPIQTNTTQIGWIDSINPVEVFVNLTLPTTTIDPTNRMVVKIYVVDQTNGNHDVTWYTEGTQYYSFVTTSLGAYSGTSGTSGVGVSGTSGTSGGNGSSGTSGVGVSGTSGTSGNNGSSGTSGAIGATGPAGSGGGQEVVPITYGGPFSNIRSYKIPYDLTGYTTSNFTMAVNNIIFVPFKGVSGEVINNMFINIGTLSAGSTIQIAVYTAGTASMPVNNPVGAQIITIPTNPTTIVTGINSGVTGYKSLINIGYTLPASPNGLYWFAVQSSGAPIISTFANIVFNKDIHTGGANNDTTFYRIMGYSYANATYTFPTTITATGLAGHTGDRALYMGWSN